MRLINFHQREKKVNFFHFVNLFFRLRFHISATSQTEKSASLCMHKHGRREKNARNFLKKIETFLKCFVGIILVSVVLGVHGSVF
jgi:hypothetical protein